MRECRHDADFRPAQLRHFWMIAAFGPAPAWSAWRDIRWMIWIPVSSLGCVPGSRCGVVSRSAAGRPCRSVPRPGRPGHPPRASSEARPACAPLRPRRFVRLRAASDGSLRKGSALAQRRRVVRSSVAGAHVTTDPNELNAGPARRSHSRSRRRAPLVPRPAVGGGESGFERRNIRGWQLGFISEGEAGRMNRPARRGATRRDLSGEAGEPRRGERSYSSVGCAISPLSCASPPSFS